MQRALRASARLFLNEPPWKASSSFFFLFFFCYTCFYIWGCWMSTNCLIYRDHRSFWKVRNAFRCTCIGSPAGGALLILWVAPGLCGLGWGGGSPRYFCHPSSTWHPVSVPAAPALQHRSGLILQHHYQLPIKFSRCLSWRVRNVFFCLFFWVGGGGILRY